MRISEYAKALISLGETFFRWAGEITIVDTRRREKIALYAEEIAATLARAAAAIATLEHTPDDHTAMISASRELGRISGYVETIVAALESDLDGRKRAGVKRRLETLEPFELEAAVHEHGAFRHARRMASAEGYFRALADSMRV